MHVFYVAICLFLCVCLPVSRGYAQTDGDVDRGDFKLHYRLMGTGDPILILSGGPGIDVDYMLPVAAELSKDHQCILLEQRGTGKSIRKKNVAASFTLDAYVDDIEALRIALKRDRWTLLGHSWGGMLGMAYAAAYPARVDRLILADSGGMTLDFYQYFGDNIRARLTVDDRKQVEHWSDPEVVKADPMRAGYELSLALLPGYLFDRNNAAVIKAHTSPENFHMDVLELVNAGLRKGHYDLKPKLAHFHRPVLIIQGRQDPIGDGTAYETHSVLTGSRLVFLNQCGHFPWLEQTEAFFKATAAFLFGGR